MARPSGPSLPCPGPSIIAPTPPTTSGTLTVCRPCVNHAPASWLLGSPSYSRGSETPVVEGLARGPTGDKARYFYFVLCVTVPGAPGGGGHARGLPTLGHTPLCSLSCLFSPWGSEGPKVGPRCPESEKGPIIQGGGTPGQPLPCAGLTSMELCGQESRAEQPGHWGEEGCRTLSLIPKFYPFLKKYPSFFFF